MSSKKFKFVSPGIFIDEIDQSQLPEEARRVGPLVIGRFERGPAMRPVRVESYSEFVEVFGNPIPGTTAGDVWRDGNYSAPTYAAFAAQAWLKNNTPLTVVRLLGEQHPLADSDGEAGWKTTNLQGTTLDKGGAFGLFVCNSGSGDITATPGTLAAVWYLEDGAMFLSGAVSASGSVGATSVLVESVGDKEFKVEYMRGHAGPDKTSTFNFNPDSDKYIRKVFNTDPSKTNATITPDSGEETYWLGESFDRAVRDTLTTTGAGQQFGFIASLKSGTTEYADQNRASIPSRTGWYIAQDARGAGSSENYGGYSADDMTKLFRLVSMDTGEWNQNNLKISIENIKPAKNPQKNYGTFSIAVRRIEDSDNSIQYIERYSNLNLDPNSPNYIARRIGDSRQKWDTTKRKLITYGDYVNQSKFIRVEMHSAARSVSDLPVGVFGHPRFGKFEVANYATIDPLDAMIKIGKSVAVGTTGTFHPALATNTSQANKLTVIGPKVTVAGFTGSFEFPAVALRSGSSDGGIFDPTKAYFGVDVSRTGSTNIFDASVRDIVRALPGATAAAPDPTTAGAGPAWCFSLDDVRYPMSGGADQHFFYQSGSRATGLSYTAVSGATDMFLTKGINKFTTLLHGGFDGWDIKEQEPLRQSRMGSSETTDYAYHSVIRAIDTVSDAEATEYNLITIPGVWNHNVTNRLLDMAEERADALAIIDIQHDYTPSTENDSDEEDNVGDITQAIDTFESRALNSSYGCAYYPWVQITDTTTDAILWVPPSVVALGSMAFGEAQQELWFAPAGFTRGGLTSGAGGLKVNAVRQHLSSKDRDDLYDANINPIASFPAEGIVIFGQKTLQVTRSALDRINVRRLMIHLKREISRIASTTLFEQNVQSTWAGFRGESSIFLDSVKARLGIVEYKLILDETTTTSELIDRNILYAKLFIKPARAIEYIALDFIITDSGASFED